MSKDKCQMLTVSAFLKHVTPNLVNLTLITPWGEAHLDAPYQRSNTEWDLAKKRSVITSLMTNRTLDTTIIIAKIATMDRYLVHDGLQRSTAIIDYYLNRFKVNGRSFSDLTKQEKTRFTEATLSLRLINVDSVSSATERFKVINLGGKKISGFTALLADRATIPGLDLLSNMEKTSFPYSNLTASQRQRMAIYTCFYFLGGERGGYQYESELFRLSTKEKVADFIGRLESFYQELDKSNQAERLRNLMCSQLGYGIVGNGLRRRDSYAAIVNQLLIFYNVTKTKSSFRKDVAKVANLTKRAMEDEKRLLKLLESNGGATRIGRVAQ